MTKEKMTESLNRKEPTRIIAKMDDCRENAIVEVDGNVGEAVLLAIEIVRGLAKEIKKIKDIPEKKTIRFIYKKAKKGEGR